MNVLTVLPLFLVIGVLGWVVVRTERRPVCSTRQYSLEERKEIWSLRMREQFGEDTEQRDEIQARGYAAQKILLEELRKRTRVRRALVPVAVFPKHSWKSDPGKRHAVAAGADGVTPRAARGSGNAALFLPGDTHASL